MTRAARIDTADWMTAEATRAVLDALGAEGTEVRFVGGCVRDAVLGRPVKDVDLATSDPPERVVALLERAGLKAVPTGIAHGTVTAVSDGRPYEVTTLRLDVETFGRHARVAFTDDWQADAARRDLTINALSCAPDGTLHDFFGGLEDLRHGRVRFVGDPRARIREDRLRLLRFFRFHAHYGRGPLDEKGLAAAAEAAPEAGKLSGERVRNELLRLLAAPDPVPVLEAMLAHDILTPFLSRVAGTAALAALLTVEPEAIRPDSLLRLAALLEPEAEVAETTAEGLRLSRAERERLRQLLTPPPELGGGTLPQLLYRQGPEATRDHLLLAWARRGETARAESRCGLDAALATAAAWRPKRFPLQGRDAVGLGVPAGPRVGELLARVEAWWIERDFAPDRAACLARLAQLAR
jgi:poly(A) polymerase